MERYNRSVEELEQALADAKEQKEIAFQEKAWDLGLAILDDRELRGDSYNQKTLYGPWEGFSPRQRAKVMKKFCHKAKGMMRYGIMDAIRDVLASEEE